MKKILSHANVDFSRAHNGRLTEFKTNPALRRRPRLIKHYCSLFLHVKHLAFQMVNNYTLI
jgi:hypothetical protein